MGIRWFKLSLVLSSHRQHVLIPLRLVQRQHQGQRLLFGPIMDVVPLSVKSGEGPCKD